MSTNTTNGKVREYHPLLKHEDVVREETETFVQRVFGGDIGLLMANLVSSKKPTKDELQERLDLQSDQIVITCE